MSARSWEAMGSKSHVVVVAKALVFKTYLFHIVATRAPVRSKHINYVSETINVYKSCCFIYLIQDFRSQEHAFDQQNINYVSKTIGFCKSCCFTYVIQACRAQEGSGEALGG